MKCVKKTNTYKTVNGKGSNTKKLKRSKPYWYSLEYSLNFYIDVYFGILKGSGDELQGLKKGIAELAGFVRKLIS